MTQAATIKLFLVQGKPSGLKTAEVSNWTGKAIAAPRSEIEAFSQREEINNPGVYLLHGIDSDTGNRVFYIGESENIHQRIKQHLAKDYWNTVIVFISKDENLTKAHVNYLEGRLIESANARGLVLKNNTQPTGAKLPEADIAEMDVFLGKIHLLLPVLGVTEFTEIQKTTSTTESALVFRYKGLVAYGNRSDNGFVIYKGSQISKTVRQSSNPSIVKLREALIENSKVIERNDAYLLLEDVEFSSPSYAAAVVCGGNQNGLLSWKNSAGETLKTIDVKGI